MRLVAIAMTLALGSCSSALQQDEDAYRLARQNGDWGRMCSLSKQLADGYLKDGDERKYQEYRRESEAACRMDSQLNS